MRSLKKIDVARLILSDRSRNPQRPEGKAFAPSNIALCKYWGKRNNELNLPITPSVAGDYTAAWDNGVNRIFKL